MSIHLYVSLNLRIEGNKKLVLWNIDKRLQSWNKKEGDEQTYFSYGEWKCAMDSFDVSG